MQETRPYQIMREVNGKVAGDSVSIEVPKFLIGQVSTTASDLFSCPYGITGNAIFTVQGNL